MDAYQKLVSWLTEPMFTRRNRLAREHVRLLLAPRHVLRERIREHQSRSASAALRRSLVKVSRRFAAGGEHETITLTQTNQRELFDSAPFNFPTRLYMAIAQVLAYVFQLRQYRRGRGEKPGMPDFPIPSDLRRDL